MTNVSYVCECYGKYETKHSSLELVLEYCDFCETKILRTDSTIYFHYLKSKWANLTYSNQWTKDETSTRISIEQLLKLVDNCKSFRENLVYKFNPDIEYNVDLLNELCGKYNEEGQKLQVDNLYLNMDNLKFLKMDDIKLLCGNFSWYNVPGFGDENSPAGIFLNEQLWTVSAECMCISDYNKLTEDHLSKIFGFTNHLHDNVGMFKYLNYVRCEEEEILWFVEQLGTFQPPSYGKKYAFNVSGCGRNFRNEELIARISKKLKTKLKSSTRTITLETKDNRNNPWLYKDFNFIIEKVCKNNK